MMRFFEDTEEFANQDRSAFGFRHHLVGHPALELGNLAKVIPTLPKNQVYFSDRRMELGENFDSAITAHRDGHMIEKVIDEIRTSSAYIMVRHPETHPAFHELHRELTADITYSIVRSGLGERALQPHSYLFISSPNSLTPFHFDRASNFLMQIQGTKEVTVFPPWDNRVITDIEYESHMARSELELKWKPESAPLGKPFHCEPGDALHIPFAAGHSVKNGSELSISLSVFFNHRRSNEITNALLMNKLLRPLLKPFGLQPTSVNRSSHINRMKSHSYRALKKAASRILITLPSALFVKWIHLITDITDPELMTLLSI